MGIHNSCQEKVGEEGRARQGRGNKPPSFGNKAPALSRHGFYDLLRHMVLKNCVPLLKTYLTPMDASVGCYQFPPVPDGIGVVLEMNFLSQKVVANTSIVGQENLKPMGVATSRNF